MALAVARVAWETPLYMMVWVDCYPLYHVISSIAIKHVDVQQCKHCIVVSLASCGRLHDAGGLRFCMTSDEVLGCWSW